MRIAFIGGGVMAEAMLSRAIAGGVAASSDICVAEPIASRREHLSKAYGVATVSGNAEALAGAGIVVLAVKPQHFAQVAAGLAGKLTRDQTVLSIIAGVTIETITGGLKHPHVIRVMPNTPAQIGAGMSVWTATGNLPEAARETATSLLGVLGREWYVEDESYLDMATALSGSGPGYVFAFIESLIEAGVEMGMPRDMAMTLSVETVAGAAKLAKETGENPSLLREMVTSPGGTTAEGLREMERRGFRATVLEAVNAAHRRAKELGGH
jgi:pyrroline-5-carboxylate reductase